MIEESRESIIRPRNSTFLNKRKIQGIGKTNVEEVQKESVDRCFRYLPIEFYRVLIAEKKG